MVPVARDNPVTLYLDDEEYAQLKEWSNDTGKSMSVLGREAILEYTDHDRVARVESELGQIHQQLAEIQTHLSQNDAHTHKEGALSTPKRTASVVEKARTVVRQLQQENENDSDDRVAIRDDQLTRKIENVSGGDPRTIQSHKEKIRQRGLLFEHPGEPPLWTASMDMWRNWMVDFIQLNGRERAEEIVEQYPATVTEGSGQIQVAVDSEMIENE